MSRVLINQYLARLLSFTHGKTQLHENRIVGWQISNLNETPSRQKIMLIKCQFDETASWLNDLAPPIWVNFIWRVVIAKMSSSSSSTSSTNKTTLKMHLHARQCRLRKRRCQIVSNHYYLNCYSDCLGFFSIVLFEQQSFPVLELCHSVNTATSPIS